MEYTVTVEQTAGNGGISVECLRYHRPDDEPVDVPTEVPIEWEGSVGTMELEEGFIHALACAPVDDSVQFSVDLDPRTPIFDPPGAPWPYPVVKPVQLVFVAGA